MTNEEIYNNCKNFEEVQEFLKDMAEKVFKIQRPNTYIDCYNNINIDRGNVGVEIEVNAGCGCCNDTTYINFPIEYILDDNWEQKETEKVKERILELDKKRKEIEEKRKYKIIENEKEILKSLKIKYEKE